MRVHGGKWWELCAGNAGCQREKRGKEQDDQTGQGREAAVRSVSLC